MNDPSPKNTELNGYQLIGEVSKNETVAQDEMIGFLLDILKAEGLNPETLGIDELRAALLKYVGSL